MQHFFLNSAWAVRELQEKKKKPNWVKATCNHSKRRTLKDRSLSLWIGITSFQIQINLNRKINFWNPALLFSRFMCPSLRSLRESSESNSLTWIHTYIHVPPPIPTLTCVLFEGELLWSASASVRRRPSQLAPAANELRRAARAGRRRFDTPRWRHLQLGSEPVDLLWAAY